MSEIINSDSQEPDRIYEGPTIEVGKWYWVKGREGKWFGCAVEMGTNYVEIEGPSESYANGTHSTRILIKDFYKHCTEELDPRGYIESKLAEHKQNINTNLLEINELTKMLGVNDDANESSNRSLSTISGTQDVKKYKNDLIKAKDKTIPELMESVRKNSELLASWMQAAIIPVKARIDSMSDFKKTIEGRIFNVDLYAGLSEKVAVVREGKPAKIADKLHLMQQRMYMDEECLLDYTSGGMDFHSIKDFDEWLLSNGNIDRLLPFPRCMAAFRVRRDTKERDRTENIFVRIQMEQADKLTFMYIKNGEQVYRMNTELEFGEKIFPDITEFNDNEPMMAQVDAFKRTKSIITKREYDVLVAAAKEKDKLYKQWAKENPSKSWIHNPHHTGIGSSALSDLNDYHQFNNESVYYDDITKYIKDQIQLYNRIALIIQGLFDRSIVFAPHIPAKLWNGDGFNSVVTLVFDKDRTIHAGDKPDFEQYRTSCNASLKPGDIIVGIELPWMEQEAERENTINARKYWDSRQHTNYRTYRPHNDDGPGYLARVVAVNGAKCTVAWTRERKVANRYAHGDMIQVKFSAEISRLLNVSAYKRGDFLQFYQDPRTRAEYTKWAPLLLAAEDYLAGKIKVGVRGDKLLKYQEKCSSTRYTYRD